MASLHLPNHSTILTTGNALGDFRAEIAAAAAFPEVLRISACKYIYTVDPSSYEAGLAAAKTLHRGNVANNDVTVALNSIPGIHLIAEHPRAYLELLQADLEAACQWMDKELLNELVGQLVDPTKNLPEAELVRVAKIMDRYLATHPASIPNEIFTALERISENENASKELKIANITGILDSKGGNIWLMTRIVVRSDSLILPFAQHIINTAAYNEEKKKRLFVNMLLAAASIRPAALNSLSDKIINGFNEPNVQEIIVDATSGWVGNKNKCKAILDSLKNEYLRIRGNIPVSTTNKISEIEAVYNQLDKYMTAAYTDISVFHSLDPTTIADMKLIEANNRIPNWIKRVIFLKYLRHRYKDRNYDFIRSHEEARGEGGHFAIPEISVWFSRNPPENVLVESLHQGHLDDLFKILIDNTNKLGVFDKTL